VLIVKANRTSDWLVEVRVTEYVKLWFQEEFLFKMKPLENNVAVELSTATQAAPDISMGQAVTGPALPNAI
jgi:hypothetical protein